MKAVLIRSHGGPEVVTVGDLPEPAPGPGEVRVAVRAAAVNHLDLWVCRGWPGLQLSFPHVLGSDMAGVVDAVGPGVAEPRVGDAVVVNPTFSCGRCAHCLAGDENLCRRFSILGEHVSGGQAERLVIPAAHAMPKPARLSFEEAAAVPVTFVTAWRALVKRAKLRLGETILVHAAGSGVGVAAVQIAKLLGARVIATAGSDAKLEKARALGADEVVNYEAGSFVEAVKKLTRRRGVDVVLEHVGKKTWEGSILSAAVGGRIVTVGATTGYDPPTDLRHVFYRQLSILGSTMGSAGDLAEVLRWLDEGRLRVVLDRTLPLGEARRAHDLLAERAQFGKIVLTP